MIINFEQATSKATKGHTVITFEKLGTPGSRRWHIVFTDKLTGEVTKRTVRSISNIKGGTMKFT